MRPAIMWVPNWIRASLYWPTRALVWRAYRPRRMYQRGRPIDAIFVAPERLFVRCGAGDVITDGSRPRLKPAIIRSDGQSTNRSKYSCCYDVILPGMIANSHDWLRCGVAMIGIDKLPVQLGCPPGQYPTEFRVEHAPDSDNYAHSEIRAYVQGTRPNKVPNTAKKEFKQMISDHAYICLMPNL
jgi:hypothetical protein